MDLFLWPGQWSLASFDPESLSLLTYAKFGGLPVNLRTDFTFSEAPNGNVPYLKHGRNVRYGLKSIFEYLRKENYGIEYEFSEEDLVRLNVLMKAVEVELVPAAIHTWLLCPDNVASTTRRLYCEAVGFPRSIYLGHWLHKRAYQLVYGSRIWPSTTVSEQSIDASIYAQAKMCLNSLSYVLGDKTYFLGDKPSAIDAVVFGFLFPIIRAPLRHNPLGEHLSHCENLSKFCIRIQTRFFDPSGLSKLTTEKSKNTNTSNTGTIEQLESAFSLTGLRNILLFGVCALAINFGYAYATNMVELDVADESEEAS